MKIFVKIKPNSKRERVEKIDKNCFKVWVKEPAKEGKANKSMHRILADYFGITKSRIVITSGIKSKEKIIEIQ